MPLVCEDLASYGVILIPPDSQQYFQLLADIERRLQNPLKDGPPQVRPEELSRISEHGTSGSAILVNRAKTSIVSLAYYWTARNPLGRESTGARVPGTNGSPLLPFLVDDRARKFNAYWNTVFPGSKRLLTFGGGMYGDNTDVRLPDRDESGGGGRIGGFGGPAGEPLKLTLDGVFFLDGAFAGPNRLGSWDTLVAARDAYLAASALARNSTPTEFFGEMERVWGTYHESRPLPGGISMPPRPVVPRRNAQPSAIRQHEQQSVAYRVLNLRRALGDEAAIAKIAAWQDNPGPEPHSL